MQGQGNGRPLVLLDSAVIVGVEIGQIAVLVQGVGLEIQAGRVNVGRRDGHPVGNRPAADYREQQGFIPVAVIHPVARLERGGPVKGDEARLFRLPDSGFHRLPLGLGRVDKGLIPVSYTHLDVYKRQGTACRAPAEDGVALMTILQAAYESAASGHEVVLA